MPVRLPTLKPRRRPGRRPVTPATAYSPGPIERGPRTGGPTRVSGPRSVAARVEQFKQAATIHRGWLRMAGMSVGVRLSRVPVPGRPLRHKLFHCLYGKVYPALPAAELEKPLADYRSVNDLFTRGVPAACRPVAEDFPGLLSPCDSTVQDRGTVSGGRILTVKGDEYKLSTLCPRTDTAPFDGGRFGILFLSPRDCHRVFSPAAASLVAVTHVPGRRLLVHPEHQTRRFPVFTLNERLVMELDTAFGRCLVVMVAGWGVGRINHPFPVRYRRSKRKAVRTELADPVPLDPGQWLATFQVGSTVILVSEADAAGTFLADPGDTLHYGVPLIRCGGGGAEGAGPGRPR